MKINQWSGIALILSFLSVALAAIGAIGVDIYLASSQWLLVAIIFGIWAIFMKLHER